jgi:hypothetical protein
MNYSIVADELEKLSKLKGKMLAIARSFIRPQGMARVRGRWKSDVLSPVWGHATTKSGLHGVLQQGLMPSREAARRKLLSHIEGVRKKLSPEEVKEVAQGKYINVVQRMGRSGFGHSQSKSVTFMHGGLPRPEHFGSYGVIGKYRQLGTDSKRIKADEMWAPMHADRKKLTDVTYLQSRVLGDEQRFKSLFRPHELHPAKRVSMPYSVAMRGTSQEGVIRKGFGRTSRSIKMVPGQNLVVVPRKEVHQFSKKYPGHHVLPWEDLQESFPEAVKSYEGHGLSPRLLRGKLTPRLQRKVNLDEKYHKLFKRVDAAETGIPGDPEPGESISAWSRRHKQSKNRYEQLKQKLEVVRKELTKISQSPILGVQLSRAAKRGGGFGHQMMLGLSNESASSFSQDLVNMLNDGQVARARQAVLTAGFPSDAQARILGTLNHLRSQPGLPDGYKVMTILGAF